MVVLKRKKPPEQDPKLARRIATLPAGEFVPWIEQCLFQIGNHMTLWGRDGVGYHLDEALMASKTATVLIQELLAREKTAQR
jgi:hypothetical protein